MPQVGINALQFFLILMAVPAQYFVSEMWGSNTEYQRTQAMRGLLVSFKDLKQNYLSLRSWRDWVRKTISSITSSPVEDNNVFSRGESPAYEVLQRRSPEGYFAGSTVPRRPRPVHVKYRVGQTIKHKRYGYRGVIIGWDVIAKAPPNWLLANHPADKPYWKKTPNYSVLVDERDRPDGQRTYVVEENIQVVYNMKIRHPDIEEYFDKFDGAQYLMRPWLRRIYPED
ncbi:F-box only protein 21-like [Branchiostoma floridae x Branchiostoma japonicum]